MRANFTTKGTLVPIFQGNKDLPEKEQLKIECTCLDMTEYLEVLAALQSVGVTEEKVKHASVDDMKSIVNITGSIIPGHFELVNADNFNNEEVLKHPAFFSLAQEVLAYLLVLSKPSEEDVKN